MASNKSGIANLPTKEEIKTLRLIPSDIKKGNVSITKTCTEFYYGHMCFLFYMAEGSQEYSWRLCRHSASILKSKGYYLGEVEDIIVKENPTSNVQTVHTLYPYKTMKGLGKYLKMCNRRFACYYEGEKRNRMNFTLILALFCSDKAFESMYNTYIAYPDPGVYVETESFDDKGIHKDFKDEKMSDLVKAKKTSELIYNGMTHYNPPSIEEDLDDADITFLQLAVVLCTAKTFNKEATDHFEKYMKARMTAFYLAIACGEKNIDIAVKQLDKRFRELSTSMLFYPRFKEVMYTYVLTSGGVLMEYCRTILSWAQASVFHFISEFVLNAHPTLAHFRTPISDQINMWYGVYTELKKEFGDNLPYIKLLKPTDQRIANKKWLMLARVAIIHRSTIDNKSALQNLRGYNLKLGPDWLKMLAKKISPELLQDPTKITGRSNLSNEVLDAMRVKVTEGIAPTFMDVDELEMEDLKDFCAAVSNKTEINKM